MAFLVSLFGFAVVVNYVESIWEENVSKPIDNWTRKREEEAENERKKEIARKAAFRKKEMRKKHYEIRERFGIPQKEAESSSISEEEKIDLGCKWM